MSRTVLLVALTLCACKGGRGKLEELVPDGATGLVSVDGRALLKSELYTKTRTIFEREPEAKARMDALKNECGLDLETLESYVVGVDAVGQNVVVAIRMPNIGKKSAIDCGIAKLLEGEDVKMVVTEVDGHAAIDVGGGEAKGWGLDDDTVVFASKGWVEAVQQRQKGDGKAAVDHYLKDAVALADRDRHIWFAAEMPTIVAPFIEDTPAKGLLRVAGGLNVDSDLDIAVAAAFADEAAAKTAKDTVQGLVDAGKAMAIEQGVPKAAVESLVIEQDAAIVRGKAKVPVTELIDSTVASFTRYMQRSKTAEARINVSGMYTAAASYAAERGGCPTDGRDEGQAGPTPPLDVDCTAGCSDASYGAKLWDDNKLWTTLGWRVFDKHYYHYDFRWKKTAAGCEFTAQAFGDLDHDGVFSTFERGGTVDGLGVTPSGELRVEQEVE